MRALEDAVASLKSSVTIFIVLGILQAAVAAQSSLNDVHITPKDVSRASTGAAGSVQLEGGSFLPVIKRDVNLVLVPVSVTDPMQRLVTGLSRENFMVWDGKQPQQIQHFSSEDTPVSVGIILDASGSMADKIDRVRDAVNQFCEGANRQDEFFMITFSDEPRLASDFTSQPEDLEKELLFIRPKGRTALIDAIYMGLEKMKEARYGKRALLIISDGGDNHSRYTESKLRAAAKESDVLMYAIGTFDRYVPTMEEALGPALLSEITEPTGGRTFILDSPNQLPAVAHRIGTELRTQYVIGYRPQEVRHDGKWHKIKVKLRLPRKLSFLQARSRKGYYAPAE